MLTPRQRRRPRWGRTQGAESRAILSDCSRHVILYARNRLLSKCRWYHRHHSRNVFLRVIILGLVLFKVPLLATSYYHCNILWETLSLPRHIICFHTSISPLSLTLWYVEHSPLRNQVIQHHLILQIII